ncbi:phenylalanine--tRNA ligase subunit alpha [bacterium]|nr:MAG: phenylalanine--tRNA ligase subunit alpha [bacterium]
MAAGIESWLEQVAQAPDEATLTQLRVRVLGRKGVLTEALKTIGSLPVAERAQAGLDSNKHRSTFEAALAARQLELQNQAEISLTPIDVTAPGMRPQLGHRHPVSMVLNELTDVFWQMGYQVVDGPEIETEWFNFEALLVDKDHPARDMQDTFYLKGGNLPRTHTSAVQIRYMMEHKDNLPIRIVAPGKVYRNEDEDARHSWSFYQIEGLVVDQGITVGDLKGTLEAMMRGVLGDNTQIRLRSNYFPYTEPSVEMDATCVVCKGTGKVFQHDCHLCTGTGWLELGGAGMVHPRVLQNVGINADKYSGFAFGFGPERIAAIKYNVPDVREFWRPNFKFLEQF